MALLTEAIRLRRRDPLVDLFAVSFGVGAWISINGLWVELPLLVQSLPEGWALPSYLSVVIQLANIGPIIYSLLRTTIPLLPTTGWYSRGCRPFRAFVSSEVPSIYGLMVIGVLSSLLIAFFWSATSYIGGVEHSTGLLVLLFFLSLVDCSSSVLFMPFMARFRQVYLTSYLIGEGLSGFLPSIFALAQGVGGNPQCRNTSTGELEAFYPDPNFSVQAFFFILMSLMIVSCIAFLALNHSGRALKERVDDEVIGKKPVPIKQEALDERSLSGLSIPTVAVGTEISKSVLIYLLVLQAWVCALSNGALPSLQSYSCLPYGNTAYHLAVTLSSMANPLACLVAYFLPITNVCLILMMTILGSGVSSYIITLAALSPEPPLVGTATGEALMITTWIVCIGVLTYVKVSIASILRMQIGRGNRNLFWFGISTQVGSAVGSIIAFLLVNVYFLFEGYYPCG